MNPSIHQSPILFFDGHCHLCSNSVKLIRRIDKNKKITLLPLQSTEAQYFTTEYNFATNLDTVLIFHRGQLYQKSEAVLEVFRIIGGGWWLLRCFRIIPLRWRDAIYDYIAQNRYRWFGRKDSCDL